MSLPPVRSYTTKVPVGQSKREMEELLRKYGAAGFTVSNDYAGKTVVVAFSIPRSFDKPTDQVEIRIPISYGDVRRKLVNYPGFPNKPDEWQEAQSERVAWRQLLLLVEAGLMAASIGVQSIEEAFFAHQMMSLPNGGELRAVDATKMVFRQLKSGHD